MAVVGQKISTLASTSILEDTDGILIQRGNSNWKLLGEGIATKLLVNTLSSNVTQNFIAKPSSAAAGQLLTWNSTTSTWVASGAPVSVPKGTETGDLLVYNKQTSTWVTQASASLIKLPDSIPIGSLMLYASAGAPAGWLPCDGRLLSKTGIYADLYKSIGDAFTTPVQANFFRIPDLRGEFVRGWDNRATSDTTVVDAGRVFGSNQSESIKTNIVAKTIPGYIYDVGNVLQSPLSGISSIGTAGKETIPRNIALLYCIKFASTESLNNFGLSAQAVINSIPFGYLGQSPQTWQDVSNSRFTDTWITNSTQRPIQVNINNADIGFSGECYVLVRPIGGNSITIQGTPADGLYTSSFLSFIVPPDHQYKVTIPNSGGIDNWVELR